MQDDDFVTLTQKQVDFLMQKFNAPDPDTAVECFIEFLVSKGEDPQNLKDHLIRMMAREYN
jgi:hypothetical protein